MNVFFDLDGTLIDSRQRLYQLFQRLVPQSQLSFDDYWNLKRNKVDHSTILREYFNYTPEYFMIFEKNWIKLIESKEYLVIDQPFEGITEFLLHLKKINVNIYLVTARQKISGVKYQLEKFGWNQLFDEILVTEQKKEKAELIKPFIDSNQDNWVIGDTGNDIQVGKSLGIKTVAVLSGFLNEKQLTSYKPDVIIENVLQFKGC